MRPQFKKDLGPLDANSDIPNGLLAVAFAAIAAWDHTPYGTNPVDKDLQSLLNATSMACNDYVLLAWYFCDLFMPETSPVIKVALGWNGGAVGNHAQMLATDLVAGISLLLDPTVGLVARGPSYNTLLKGVGVPGSTMMASFKNFNSYPGSTGPFTDQCVQRRERWAHKPTDCLNYVDNLETYAAMQPENNWLTQQSAALTD